MDDAGREGKPHAMRPTTPPRGWPVRPVLLGAALLLVLAACDGAGQEKAEGPPWGLDTLALPTDAPSVFAVLEALPQEVDGLARSPSGTPYSVDALLAGEHVGVAYGEAHPRPGVGVLSLDATRAFAEDTELTLADFLSDLAQSREGNVEAQQLDPGGALVYVVYAGTEDGRSDYNVAWAAPDGAWLFSASAGRPELRAAVVAAFAAAVRTASP